ncbi:hypothetical protein PPYR_05232 [Photinus pyralis]|uniref:Aminopeptidase n=1 Tax=Photinus pyralis TaxID=7054 RepID=A0A1Y1LUJ7_PHOPY|nr:aminopeptidase N-like [Photinus pyralis]XP_031337632.1 aminopeptidase N-like [Photinus pyralis]XP_031337633.1 aminopeptidase N-like [Photinus pyralis]XP_031337634.1 aminopeptidase N-like [Photinus pyralis]XP_031337635.1 aminopeptidase N-like [Photinus pyralis]XP_031337636.1 aminopeptidase N-like [Photinus pyralis]KAB0800625.1 hypothetical protein PPYR_06365 [Photinus pyralis]KAB0800878.1 hypothetical protein PPYR_05232 [Photinus pyralis]
MIYFFVFLWICGIWVPNVAANEVRLPPTLIPEHYSLEIITDLNNFNFSGKVWIRVKCIKETNQVVLHSEGLTINTNGTTVKTIDADVKNSIKLTNFSFNEENDFFTIILDQPLKLDQKYEIFIPFNRTLDQNLDGYYRSSYDNPKTKRKEWLSVTQFEPTSARSAFPCFDEPSLKAIFNISLGRTEKYSSISNMPLSKTEPIRGKPGWVWDRYEETVPISTYLIAFVVSDFEYKESPPNNNSAVFRIWARSNAINQVEFAKNVGPKCLQFYENFFDIKYPLPKQDMIAIPDFNAGAMENWGLITYRETVLLFDNSTSSEVNKHSIVSVIAHELAHQWFGNLVTMKWWTDLWLNEGFATHMAALAVHNLFPEWNSLSHETVSNMLSVFSLDALKSSHPVSVTVANPKEINEIFDIISYKKGSFLLHMIRNFLSEKTFKNGVTHYLNKHKFSNAEQDDLWQALTEQAHEDASLLSHLTVKEIMDTWTLQTGFPLVTVIRNYQTNSAQLSQERFLLDTLEREKKNSCWWIPITYTTQRDLNFKSTKPLQWMTCPQGSLSINNLPNNDQWILFNLNVSGLYRINYDEDNWKMLIKTLQSDLYSTIGALNRVQLIEDSGALAWVGKLPYSIYFDVLDYLRYEKEYLPWKSALSNIDTVEKLIRRTSAFGAFKEFMNALISPIYNDVGGLNKKPTKNLLESTRYRSMITSWGCKFRVGTCVQEAREVFNKWLENPSNNIIPKELRSVVYCTAVKHGGEAEWNFLWNQYKTTNTATEKSLILSTLGCTREVWLLERYMDWAIDDTSGIRKQDALLTFTSVAKNEVGYYVAKNFVWKRIGDIQNYLGVNSRRVSSLISTLASQMIYEEDYQELKNFTIRNSNYLVPSKQAIEQSLESVRLQVQWHKSHFHLIKEKLSAYDKV